MNEKPRPNIEMAKLTYTLIRLQEVKEKAEETAQSVDDSEGLVDSALTAGLLKSEINRSTSSS